MSLKKLLRGSSSNKTDNHSLHSKVSWEDGSKSSSTSPQPPQHEVPQSSNSSTHRSFLKKRSSGNSNLSPQTSSGSLASLIKRSSSTSNTSPVQSNNTHLHVAPPVHSATSMKSGGGTASFSSDYSISEDHSIVHGSQTVTPKRVERRGSAHSNNSSNGNGHHHHQPNALKRFFKKLKQPSTPSSSTVSLKALAAASLDTEVSSSSALYQKYGAVGKLLGAGASGSVNLVALKSDPTQIFAIKKFRSRLPTENELDYKIKVKNEFKIGEYLNHENLIHTIELISDYPTNVTKKKSKSIEPDYHIVMEYCEYDFFNLVMSGLMETNEVACYFKQIVNGVHFLHENGLAHRDLKLDNCVVNGNGILKLIDFGSAVQFRKVVDKSTVLDSTDELINDGKYRLIKARGVVGSDPYLSPEVFEPTNLGYDPRLADVWSIAIIFCCMILRRFPWKIPKLSDASYRSYLALGSSGDLTQSMNDLNVNGKTSSSASSTTSVTGPDRLLRLLPTHSRDLIRNMLVVDYKKRYLMTDVVEHEYYKSIDHCHNLTHDHFDEADGNDDDFEDAQDSSIEEKQELDIYHKPVYKATNHQHHLILEEDLKKLNAEKERLKKLKEAGVA
ncbi:putative serine/threonine-protein kinase [Scheffersomyces amazonensis]|uniref:putative serine/threonine-protein kinase n=1 Tax=Scheffersomyces amazonensis TaxID=1078765 RepID=UPI00315CBA17